MSTLIFTWQGVGWGEESNARYCGGWLFLRGVQIALRFRFGWKFFFRRRWNGRERWLAQPGPHFLGRNGGKNPRGKRFFPLDSLLWWGCVGGGCTSYGIPGLRPSQRKARNGPPTGWAGWGRGWVPFGRRQKVTVWFPTFSSRQQTTSPARPSWWAGHEALVLEAAGQVR